MFTYAVIMTWLVGFAMGIIALGAVFVWIDGREEKKSQAALKARTEARHARLNQDVRSEGDDDAAMQEAVDLVSDKLGASILSYEKN